jgi:prepilin-type N-terminal cleavage/methylation domain-containing protein
MKTAKEKLQIKRQNAGFTLVELLTVIAVIAVIAGFTLVVVTGIKKTEYINAATAEMMQLETALDNYQHKYGAYPPSNAGALALTNTLYYELSGVTLSNINNVLTYTTLDGASSITQPNYKTAFTGGGNSIDGVINCTKGSAEEGTTAQNFLLGLRQNRFGTVSLSGSGGNFPFTTLITSARGPDLNYKPMMGVQDVNPFRYQYPGTNNPNSYDLWVELVIGGKTNLICNWSKQVVVNSALP